jgi:hypothetical protein
MDEADLASAKFWLPWLNLAKTLGGIGIFVALAVRILADWVAGPLREKVDRDRELHMAELTKEVEQSRVAIAIANAAAAKASERAAEFERDAEQARADQERFKQQAAWRELTPKIAAQMRDTLARQPRSAVLAYIANDPEAVYLAIQVSKVLTDAKWTTAGIQARTYAHNAIFGINVSGPNAVAVALLRGALSDAHLASNSDTLPPFDAVSGNTSGPVDVEIMIGSKHPPL